MMVAEQVTLEHSAAAGPEALAAWCMGFWIPLTSTIRDTQLYIFCVDDATAIRIAPGMVQRQADYNRLLEAVKRSLRS
ncbi:MAG TPA: hypothetical protein GXX40_08640 [Firmicutes bacterium]|nr:hypothetical protein [Bacillota bacterium]